MLVLLGAILILVFLGWVAAQIVAAVMVVKFYKKNREARNKMEARWNRSRSRFF